MSEQRPDAERILDSVEGPILLFDGVCTLCNGVVRFVVEHDRRGLVSFAPLDSPVGRALCDRFGLPTESFDSVVLIERGRAYRKSAAALRLARYLDRPWRYGASARVLPRALRDAVYDLVADNRYRVFGRKDRCPIPDPETRDRFLDGAFADPE
ncbi:MAG: thiol-disulfide oxidoreductase DCC family protein [Halobaculum sp.]